ncbi:cf9ae228-55c8-42a2-b1c0-81a5fbbe8894 [Thermothielavioides terrestris]|uniref:Cf9ae228-55c8-42a2-b1c0-81a5fbbe8894 n=1 Tax=Thermothielavioides terrestris TaxID=2587410 RepID=A0A446B8U5_9PEZI|nr:cf9ae228-55c8-42a2-b1c0-81a5fbbe8894 [Thermothielavioides terrestris]
MNTWSLGVDREGLPFAKRDLSADEVVAIFGPHISTTAANQLLRILHGRRVAGTLDDPALRVNTMVFSAEHQKRALEYLRSRVPVDEIANAGLRAEDELAALENGAAGDEGGQAEQPGSGPEYGTRLKLYRETDSKPAAKDSKPAAKESVYGPSALDAIRAQKKAQWEAELERREAERKKREEEERHGVAGPLQVADKPPVRQLSPKMQEYMRKGQSDLKEPPKMKKWQRLLPSAAFVVAVCGLCLAFAVVYRPPKRADRLFPDIPPAAATVGALMLANLIGWALWKIPPIWGFLNRHFIIVAATPRAPMMLSAVFSHVSLLHLLQNMAILWFLGVRLHDDIGRGPFLATYFASGAVGSLGMLTWAVLRNRLDLCSLGASGAVYGVGAAYFWLHRFEYFKIFGLPPPPSEGIQGLALLALAAGLNLSGYFTAARFKVDITSHLVGMVAGIVAAYLLERTRPANQQQSARATHRDSLAKAPSAAKA